MESNQNIFMVDILQFPHLTKMQYDIAERLQRTCSYHIMDADKSHQSNVQCEPSLHFSFLIFALRASLRDFSFTVIILVGIL